MTLTIPPMPEVRLPLMPTSTRLAVGPLEFWGKRGWAEAERLEKEKKSHEEAHWHMVGQYNHVEKERDEARAEVERLKDALHRNCPDHDHRPKAEKGYKCAHCLEEAWAERDEAKAGIDAAYMRGCEVGAKHFGEVERALRAQVKDLAEALESVTRIAGGPKYGAGQTTTFDAIERIARAALSRLASADQRTTDTSSQ